MRLPPVSIIIPVYNERRGLPRTVEQVREVLERLPKKSEAIFVDDGSRDGGGRVLEAAAEEEPRVQVLSHPRNRGYGAALKTGVKAAHNKVVAIADADGSYPLEELPRLLEVFQGAQAAMVVGARPGAPQPVARRLAKTALRWLAEYLTGERIADLNSGLRVFRREDALRLGNLLPDGFSFTTTITMALLTEGERVLFEPIAFRARLGHSKIRPVRDTSNFLLLICRTALAFHPMKVFGPVGLILCALGLLLLLVRLLSPEAFGVATTVVLLVAGIQVLAIGLLADLVNRRGSG